MSRRAADLVLHGHAHHGKLDGRTTAAIPVHNVAITLLESQEPRRSTESLRFEGSCRDSRPRLSGRAKLGSS